MTSHEPPVPAEREGLLERLDDMRSRCGEGHIDRQALSDLLDGLWHALLTREAGVADRTPTANPLDNSKAGLRDHQAREAEVRGEERAAIVAWLRTRWGGAWEAVHRSDGIGAHHVPNFLADIIERGDYAPPAVRGGD